MWSLSLLQKALHRAADGLTGVSGYTLWPVSQDAGYSSQHSRSWCKTGEVIHKLRFSEVVVTDPDADAKNTDRECLNAGRVDGPEVWCTDQVGPVSAVPKPGSGWAKQSAAPKYSHGYIRHGTGRILSLLHPADGVVCVEGVTSTTNEILHGWLKRELTVILKGLPPSP